jgi:hypothetical protein
MWEHTFDNRMRHCWVVKDGNRYLDGSMDLPCTTNHLADPTVVGKVEWMRFIHEVGEIMGEDSPFLSGVSISQDREVYSDLQGQARATLSFLHSDPPKVIIEAVDRTLEKVFDQALKAVEESYK